MCFHNLIEIIQSGITKECIRIKRSQFGSLKTPIIYLHMKNLLKNNGLNFDILKQK